MASQYYSGAGYLFRIRKSLKLFKQIYEFFENPGNSFRCTHCNKSFANKNVLTRHESLQIELYLKTHINTKMSRKCLQCSELHDFEITITYRNARGSSPKDKLCKPIVCETCYYRCQAYAKVVKLLDTHDKTEEESAELSKMWRVQTGLILEKGVMFGSLRAHRFIHNGCGHHDVHEDGLGTDLLFTQCFGNLPPPQFEHHCVCRHPIHVQCYVSNGVDYDTLMVLGNCCVLHYICKKYKRCSMCREIHRNRSDNYCKACRKIRKEQAAIWEASRRRLRYRTGVFEPEVHTTLGWGIVWRVSVSQYD
jgi:hypothetical protein